MITASLFLGTLAMLIGKLTGQDVVFIGGLSFLCTASFIETSTQLARRHGLRVSDNLLNPIDELVTLVSIPPTLIGGFMNNKEVFAAGVACMMTYLVTYIVNIPFKELHSREDRQNHVDDAEQSYVPPMLGPIEPAAAAITEPGSAKFKF